MEILYHYLWKNKFFGLSPRLDSGEEVTVIDPGLSNPDAGPDFFNAKIRTGNIEWAGNIEIHVRASDWYRHKHDSDPSYDSVILHVVGSSDRTVTRRDGSSIPQLVIPVPKNLQITYDRLQSDLKSVRCADRVKNLSRLQIIDWVDSLATERLQDKTSRILNYLEQNGGNLNEAAFTALARGLGFGLNADAFERLARSLPLNFLLRHSDDILQVEALLFGQSSLLPEDTTGNSYATRLKEEYRFLKNKYGLSPIPREIWRFARTRPQNHPHRKIAFLASALSGAFPFPSKLASCAGSTDKIRKLFKSFRLSNYWAEHYNFESESVSASHSLSISSIDLLLINVVAPWLYAVSIRSGDPDMAEKASDIWLSLKPERNSIVSGWSEIGISPDNAFESQGLIQLRREYCDRSRCLNCRFGHALLRSEILST